MLRGIFLSIVGAFAVAGEPLAQTFRKGLREQALRELEANGESITIMVVGESGLGKTSLLSSLFRTELVWANLSPGQPTKSVAEQTVGFDLEGMPFMATLVDTPGYGEFGPDARRGFSVVLQRIDDGFRRVLNSEARIKRCAPRWTYVGLAYLAVLADALVRVCTQDCRTARAAGHR